ncbi:methyltransferase domain-containing protein [Candidatus Woesearchaeota archaeon]|nr:methyltransferase domain-containing protein [Candidatus Woesearchaeota archaeon]
MFSTGLASLLYEVVLLSVVVTIVGATEISASIVIASFLLGLAIGALIGGNLVKRKFNLISILILIEVFIALFGFLFLSIVAGIASIGLSFNAIFWIVIAALLVPTALMGMEIPIAVRILENLGNKNVTGFVYFSDTLGGVIGALFSGILFIPILGFHGAMYFGGFLNILTAILATRIGNKRNTAFLASVLVIFIIGLSLLFVSKPLFSKLKLDFLDSFYSIGSLFSETYYTEVVYSEITPFQHILIIKSPYYGNQLVLDGKIQISDKESMRYHEYLVLPAMAAHPNPKSVLVIGGGDGGALYQLLKFNLTRIDHVELDKSVIEVSKKYLKNVHKGSLDDKRVDRIIMDGRRYLKHAKNDTYDVIIIDLPDPKVLEVVPLYTKEFYEEIKRVLRKDGFVVTQADSPYYFLEGYTSIYKTMKAVMPLTFPYLFPGSASGSIGYIISGKSLYPGIVRNYAVSGVWYSSPDNEFLFKFPKFLQNYFNNNTIQISTDENPIVHVYMQNNYYFKGVADQ